MELMNTIRWDEVLGEALRDPCGHVLVGMLLLLLAAGLVCCGQGGSSRADV